VVLLVDNSTDQILLEDILLGLIQSEEYAPRRVGDGEARMRLLRLDGSAAAGVHKFLRLSDEIVTMKTAVSST
jgi:hypothetical protein